MLRKLIATGVALGLATAGTTAQADRDDQYRGGKYANGADYARVVNVDPIMREVRVSVPREECWDEKQPYSNAPPTAGGMILGGLIGGVIGHQFGHGHHQQNATIAGAVVGSAIGHDVSSRRAAAYGTSYRVVQRCETRYDEQVEQRIDGYHVTYEYAGRTYQTRLPYDPGDRLPVRVNVIPAGR